MWESLALWCSAWVASFLGWARCHRIPRARRGATMLCTCRAALGQGDEITVRACVRGGGGGAGRQAMARQLLNGLLIHALLSLSFHLHPRTPRLRVILPAPRLHHRECCPLCRWVGQRLPDGGSAQLEDLDGEVIDDRTLKFWEMRVEEHLFGASPSGAAAPGKAPYALKHARASSILGAKCCVDKRAH